MNDVINMHQEHVYQENTGMKRIITVLLFTVAFAMIASLVANAGNFITLSLQQPSYEDNGLHFSVAKQNGVSQIQLKSDGKVVATALQDHASAETTFTVVAPDDSHEYTAVAYDASGVMVAMSNSIYVNLDDYRPLTPSWDVTDNMAIPGRLTINGNVDDRTQSLYLAINGKITYRTTPVNGVYGFKNVWLRQGYSHIQVIACNAWGKTFTKTALVRSGTVKPLNYILVSKGDMSLSLFENGKLSILYPIAIGTPATPTPAGVFYVGKKLYTSPDGDWGARRLVLYQKRKDGPHYSGYNIHGTNRPSSIGKMASHGCIRLYNEDVIQLFDKVKIGSAVFVEE
ncbi:MAG TPA: L,D-transpeptidase [Candidatus Aquicultor sp.]|jgi:hypothetical protein